MNEDYYKIFTKVLTEEATALQKSATLLTKNDVQLLVELYKKLLANQKSLILCGVGKSGIIAQKIAATFSSLGLNSWYLHPTEAMHGDMGKCQEEDAIVFISKSGVTEEILKMMPYLPMPSTHWIALVGNPHSDIAKKCSIFFDCSVTKEACLNNLAPTTSSTVSLAVGDAMAVVFESLVGLSKETFARNHPGGLLGKSLTLKVDSIMVAAENTAICFSETPMKEVILLMTRFPTGICCVVSTESNVLKGIVVEGDIRRHLTEAGDFLNWPVSKIMNTSPKYLNTDSLALDALKLMEEKNKMVYVLPVINEKKEIKGVLRLHDLVREGFSFKD